MDALFGVSNLRSLGRSFVVFATQDESAFYFKTVGAFSDLRISILPFRSNRVTMTNNRSLGATLLNLGDADRSAAGDVHPVTPAGLRDQNRG